MPPTETGVAFAITDSLMVSCNHLLCPDTNDERITCVYVPIEDDPCVPDFVVAIPQCPKLLEACKVHDIVLLKVDRKRLSRLSLRSAELLKPHETVYVAQRADVEGITVHQTFKYTTSDWGFCGFFVKTNSAYGWSDSPVVDRKGYVVGMLRRRSRKNTIVISSDSIREVLEVLYPNLENSGIKKFLMALHGDSKIPLSHASKTRVENAFIRPQTSWTEPDDIKFSKKSWTPATLKLGGLQVELTRSPLGPHSRQVAPNTFETMTRRSSLPSRIAQKSLLDASPPASPPAAPLYLGGQETAKGR